MNRIVVDAHLLSEIGIIGVCLIINLKSNGLNSFVSVCLIIYLK